MCFSMPWLIHILIYAIVLGAIVAIGKLVAGYFGVNDSFVMRVIQILVVAIVVIGVLLFFADLLSCAYGRSPYFLR